MSDAPSSPTASSDEKSHWKGEAESGVVARRRLRSDVDLGHARPDKSVGHIFLGVMVNAPVTGEILAVDHSGIEAVRRYQGEACA